MSTFTKLKIKLILSLVIILKINTLQRRMQSATMIGK